MLNLSPENNIENVNEEEEFSSFSEVNKFRAGRILARILLSLLLFFILILFLPWTQVIHGNGEITTQKPHQRPQKVPSVISGRIQDWHVQEGDTVQNGDTIIQIREVKDKYFDPKLVERTKSRIKSKKKAMESYKNKITNLNNQIEALKQNRALKLQQLNNKIKQANLKITSDSMNLEAAKTNFEIAENQFDRIKKLQKKGLKSLSDLQEKRLKYQSTLAKKMAAKNKLLISRNNLVNLTLDKNQIRSQFQDKISKAMSKRNSAESAYYSAEAKITKLENQLTNYQTRMGYHTVRAPQNGIVTKVIQNGIGEMIKEGETVVSIMPINYNYAVELYVRPRDYPLIHKGEHVRLQFDGWPSIIFSGWPTISHGTFKGEIYAIDNFLSPNGKFRIMVSPAGSEEWPDALRAGSGAKGMIMLKDVPVWYEIWRQLNGFPPKFYKPKNKKSSNKEK